MQHKKTGLRVKDCVNGMLHQKSKLCYSAILTIS